MSRSRPSVRNMASFRVSISWSNSVILLAQRPSNFFPACGRPSWWILRPPQNTSRARIRNIISSRPRAPATTDAWSPADAPTRLDRSACAANCAAWMRKSSSSSGGSNRLTPPSKASPRNSARTNRRSKKPPGCTAKLKSLCSSPRITANRPILNSRVSAWIWASVRRTSSAFARKCRPRGSAPPRGLHFRAKALEVLLTDAQIHAETREFRIGLFAVMRGEEHRLFSFAVQPGGFFERLFVRAEFRGDAFESGVGLFDPPLELDDFRIQAAQFAAHPERPSLVGPSAGDHASVVAGPLGRDEMILRILAREVF